MTTIITIPTITASALFLETPFGIVFGADTIARCVFQLKNRKTLCGSSMIEHVFVEQWIAFSTSFTSQFCHVEKYFWYMVKQPNFQKILGEVKQMTVPPFQSTEENPEKIVVNTGPEMPEPMNSHDLLSAKITLDEWKGNYFNTNTNFRKVAIKGFWKMYNPDTSSLWFCDSKYNAENSVTFK
ncbi:elongation factor 1-gamma 2-like protein, partial [Trifolium pratense]